MSNWDGLNRRKFPRVNYPCLVVIRQAPGDQEALLTHTENVGVGGICVTLKENVRIFSLVELELDLLDLQEHMKCKGKVVWNVRRKNDENKKPLFYDIGIEFVDLDPTQHKRLSEVIARLVVNHKETPYT